MPLLGGGVKLLDKYVSLFCYFVPLCYSYRRTINRRRRAAPKRRKNERAHHLLTPHPQRSPNVPPVLRGTTRRFFSSLFVGVSVTRCWRRSMTVWSCLTRTAKASQRSQWSMRFPCPPVERGCSREERGVTATKMPITSISKTNVTFLSKPLGLFQVLNAHLKTKMPSCLS